MRKSTLAAEAWRLMFAYLTRTSPARTRALAARKLTPNDARALHTLTATQGMPMGELARIWSCDPSMATWIVDRLDRMGLVEREPEPGDRRVKRVVLTAKGVALRDELMTQFNTPPPEMSQLTREDLEALRRIMGILLRARAAKHE